MVEQTMTEAEKKSEEEKVKSEEELKRQSAEIKKQEDAEEKLQAVEAKKLEEADKARVKVAEAEEKKHSLIVVDVGAYVGKVDANSLQGVPRRLEGIRMMFEEYGPENFVEKVSYKGTEAYIFKKKGY